MMQLVAVIFACICLITYSLAAAPLSPSIAFPLKTSGRFIVDNNNQRVHLAGVNWYGFDEMDFVAGGLHVTTIDEISSLIVSLGFNFVRLPWSLQMVEQNPVAASKALAANPDLVGMKALDLMDMVVYSLAKHGVLIMLDNHMSNSDWCCSTSDGNGLWWNTAYPQSQWIADWVFLADRYRNVTNVIGADLRNELRSSNIAGTNYNPQWGGGDSNTDWPAAAALCANQILAANPNLLIMVEGLNYALDLSGVGGLPIQLDVPNRVVYEAHNYGWDYSFSSYDDMVNTLNKSWAYIALTGLAPVLLGEFGTCNNDPSCVSSQNTGSQGWWFGNLIQFVKQYEFDYSYWALDGTQSSGTGRTFGAVEGYGITNVYWNASALPALTQALQSVQ